MGSDFDRLDHLSVPELQSLERAEDAWPEFHERRAREAAAAADARTPRGLLAALAGDPMDADPLLDESPRDRYWEADNGL